MSSTAAHESKQFRRSCQVCRERKARFRYRGKVRADRDHALCFACFRSARDRRRAELLIEVQPRPLRSPFAPVPLTAGEIAHRRRMVEYLGSCGRRRAGGGGR